MTFNNGRAHRRAKGRLPLREMAIDKLLLYESSRLHLYVGI